MVSHLSKPKRFHPLSEYQDEIATLWNDPQTTDTFREYTSIKWAFLVTPRVNERRIRIAFDKLTMRHDSLRLRLVQFPTGCKAEILSKHPTGLLVEDLGDMGREEMLAEVNRRAQRILSVFDDALFQMHLLKFGKLGDVVLTHVHHAVIDGYSVVILIEEMLKHFMSLPVTNIPLGHADFIAHRANAMEKNDERNLDYWKNELLPLQKPPQIGRVAKGMEPITKFGDMSETHQIVDLFSRYEIDALAKISAPNGLSVYSYLFAAFAEVICEESGSDHAVINCIIGRNEAVMSSFIGAEMQYITLNIPHAPKLPLNERARIVATKRREGVEHIPTSAFRTHGILDQSFREAGRGRYQFLVHIPQSLGRMKRSPFRKLFFNAMAGKISFGLIAVERLQLEKTSFTNFEVSLTMEDAGDGLVATLSSDKKAFTLDELGDIRAKMAAIINSETGLYKTEG